MKNMYSTFILSLLCTSVYSLPLQAMDPDPKYLFEDIEDQKAVRPERATNAYLLHEQGIRGQCKNGNRIVIAFIDRGFDPDLICRYKSNIHPAAFSEHFICNPDENLKEVDLLVLTKNIFKLGYKKSFINQTVLELKGLLHFYKIKKEKQEISPDIADKKIAKIQKQLDEVIQKKKELDASLRELKQTKKRKILFETRHIPTALEKNEKQYLESFKKILQIEPWIQELDQQILIRNEKIQALQIKIKDVDSRIQQLTTPEVDLQHDHLRTAIKEKKLTQEKLERNKSILLALENENMDRLDSIEYLNLKKEYDLFQNTHGVAVMDCAYRLAPHALFLPIPAYANKQAWAIKQAIRYDADIINISRTIINVAETQEAFAETAKKGIPIIIAAGNDSEKDRVVTIDQNELDLFDVPGANQNVFFVGNIEYNLRGEPKLRYSSQIPDQKTEKNFMCVVGTNVSVRSRRDELYTPKSGTSYSAPFFSAGLALLIQHTRDKGYPVSPVQLLPILYESGQDVAFTIPQTSQKVVYKSMDLARAKKRIDEYFRTIIE